MKRQILFSLLLMLMVAVLLSSCKVNGGEHVHSLSEVAEVAPSCTEAGTERYYTCSSCDKLFADAEGSVEIDAPKAIKANGHTFTDYTSNGDATCEKDGTKTAKCDNCNAQYIDIDAGSKLGHTFTNYVSNGDATCEADGTKTAKCDRCDATDTKADEGSKKAHTFTSYVSNGDATCLADGTKTAKCDNCDATDTKADEGSKKGHSFTSYVSNGDATCEADGTKTAKCDRCEVTDTKADEGSKKGHAYGDLWASNENSHWHVCSNGCGIKGNETTHIPNIEAATEYDSKICTVCHYVIEEALGHTTHNYTIPQKDETHHWNKCYGCNEIDVKVAHNYEESIVNNATCTELGSKTLTCDCGYSKSESISALGHNEVPHDAKAPTCLETGYDAYVECSRCDYTTYVEKAALGHDEVPHDAKAPTCLEAGYDAYVECSRCDYTTYVEKAALGHNEVPHDAKAPTCLETGYDAYVECSRCDYTTYVEKAALGHDEVPHDAKAPTCLEAGYDAYVTCSRCDYTTYVEKAALGHDEVSHDAKAPTCLETGYDAYVECSRCDYTTYVEKAALGHNEVPHDAKAPTCTEVGNEAYVTCSRCDYTTYVEKAALGHAYAWIHTMTTSPSYTAEGAIESNETCNVCGAVNTTTNVTVPVVSKDTEGYELLVTGVSSRWQYTYEGVKFIIDLAEENVIADTYTFGVDAWYSSLDESGNPVGSENFKYTDATWNTSYFGGGNKTYTTTIMVDKPTAVTLLLNASRDGALPIFSDTDEHVLDCIKINNSTTAVVYNMNSRLETGSQTVAVATLYLEAGSNVITFNTSTSTNFMGIGFISTEKIELAESSLDLALMTFNIRLDADSGVKSWAQRKSYLIESIVTRNPSVVCFQEVKQNQYNDLAAGLRGYTVVWYGRENGSNPEGLAIAYKTANWTEVSRQMFWLSATPGTMSNSWDDAYKRICVNTLLQDKVTGQYLNVFSVHLGLTITSQTNGIQLILDEAQKYDYPTFIAGDFNCTDTSVPYGKTAALYRDTQKYAFVTEADDTFQGWGSQVGDDVAYMIDFCFVSDHFTSLELDICQDKWGTNDANYLSDHYAVMTNVILPIPHIHEVVVDKAVDPTCTETGLTEGSHCGTCGVVLVEQTVINSLGHTVATDAAVAPTCTAAGKTEGSHCSVCNEIFTEQTTIDPIGHSYDDEVDTDCNVCGFVRYTGCAHANKVVISEAIAPTCTVAGNTAGEKCADCGEVFLEQEILPALGHDTVVDAAVEPTCTDTGLTEGSHCKTCNEVFVAQEAVAATNHANATFSEQIDATFESEGYVAYYACPDCNCFFADAEYTKSIVPFATPKLNLTDYTTHTTRPAFATSVSVTTEFTLVSDEVEYSVSLASTDFLVVNRGDGEIYVTKYNYQKLNTDIVTVTYEEGVGYVYSVAEGQTETGIIGAGIRSAGTIVTITGNVELSLTARWGHNNGLVIGTAEKPANVTFSCTATNGAFCLWDGADLTVNEGSTFIINSNYADSLWASTGGTHVIVDGTLICDKTMLFESPSQPNWTSQSSDGYNVNPELYIRKGTVTIKSGQLLTNTLQVGSVKDGHYGTLNITQDTKRDNTYSNTINSRNQKGSIRYIFSNGKVNLNTNISVTLIDVRTSGTSYVIFDSGITVDTTGGSVNCTNFIGCWSSGSTYRLGLHADAKINHAGSKIWQHGIAKTLQVLYFDTATVNIDGVDKNVFIAKGYKYNSNKTTSIATTDLTVDNGDGTKSLPAITVPEGAEFVTGTGTVNCYDWAFKKATYTDEAGTVYTIYYQIIG